ncbi:MAG: hypothetical protein HYY78_23190 [Betaproteobacteria bacterium]|nr:hypothetical protein [Betaproteobacteria bacterium]
MKFSLLFASIFVQAVLHKEFVGAQSDKLLAVFLQRRLKVFRDRPSQFRRFDYQQAARAIGSCRRLSPQSSRPF